MFPNVRLMIAAIVASTLGMSCGLGVFAVFRVNHDPFARLPNAAPPLQLASSNTSPFALKDSGFKDSVAPDATVAPFGVRFELNQPLNAGTTVPQAAAAPETAATPANDAASDAATAETPQTVATVEPQSESETATATIPAPASADDAAVTVSAPPAAAPASDTPGDTANASPSDMVDTSPATAAGDAPDAATDKTGQAAVETAVIDPVPADQTVQDNNLAPEVAKIEDARPNGKTESADIPAKKTAHTVAKRQRVAKARRVRKARARAIPASADQYAGYSQPAYQFTSAAQTKPVRVRGAARNSAARSATR
jgi:hypothetical protein